MQSLDVISVNIWHIVISLCNLFIIFLLLKKFLYAPVRKVVSERQKAIDDQLADAAREKAEAAEKNAALSASLAGAKEQADAILKDAAATADRKSADIVAAAKEQAQRIVADAEADAALVKEKAQADMKREIVDVSALMAGALLRREVTVADKEALADAFIDSIE